MFFNVRSIGDGWNTYDWYRGISCACSEYRLIGFQRPLMSGAGVVAQPDRMMSRIDSRQAGCREILGFTVHRSVEWNRGFSTTRHALCCGRSRAAASARHVSLRTGLAIAEPGQCGAGSQSAQDRTGDAVQRMGKAAADVAMQACRPGSRSRSCEYYKTCVPASLANLVPLAEHSIPWDTTAHLSRCTGETPDAARCDCPDDELSLSGRG